MRFVTDHDLHIHSELSSCSRDPEQNPANLLAYGEKNGFSTMCLTDHFWDSDVPGASGWYKPQNYEHISKALPLPQSDKVKFLFGVETDFDRNCTLGVAPEHFDLFDFIIVPTTHLHMNGFTCRGDESAAERTKLWVDRFDALLSMDLPFHKIGIAHLTCGLVYRDAPMEVLRAIPEAEMHRLFEKSAKLGIGIELNFNSLKLTDEKRDLVLRPYRIAKEHGCKFYFGSDSHHPNDREDSKENFENIVTLLELDESDKFVIGA
ncbi:MAG: PHP domain-containing protein [Ruminococcaceae bacterium]|nr:PHP domain-containing protein [Oscillospiraceae bacterium]